MRSRARGFALRSAHGSAHGGAHGDGRWRAEPHTYQSKFSAGVALREHTTQQPDRRIDAARGEQPAHSVCVITVSGEGATVAIAVKGEKQFCLEQGKNLTGPCGKCFPDPRKTTTVIIY